MNDPGEAERRTRLGRAFAGETAGAFQLVLDQPEHWQHYLVVELLRDRVARQGKRRTLLRHGLMFIPSRVTREARFSRWILELFKDVPTLIEVGVRVLNDRLTPAMSASPPDPVELLDAVRLIDGVCDGFFYCEKRIARTVFPERFADLKDSMVGMTDGFYSQFAALPDRIAEPLAREHQTDIVHTVELKFELPQGFQALAEELRARFDEDK